MYRSRQMLSSSNVRIIVAMLISLGVHFILMGADLNRRQTSLPGLPEKRTVHVSLKARRVAKAPVRKPEKRQTVPEKKQFRKKVKPVEPVRKPEPKPFIPEKPPQPVAPAVEPVDVVVKEIPPPVDVPEITASESEHAEVLEQAEVADELAHSAAKKIESREVQRQEAGFAGVTEARPLYRDNPPPRYPRTARRRRYEGTVMLEVLVSIQGRVRDLRLAESSGYDILDEAAVEAVRDWSFEPGRRGRQPMEMWVKIPIKFQLQ